MFAFGSDKSLIVTGTNNLAIGTDVLRPAGDLAEKYNCMIQSHMSESIDEVEFSASLFGQMDAEVFSNFGLLRGAGRQPASVMAHCVQMQEAEERLLKVPWICSIIVGTVPWFKLQ